MFLVICLNPVLQKTLVLNNFIENQVNRCSEYYFDLAGKGIHVARILSQLGKQSSHLTFAGGRFFDVFHDFSRNENFSIHTINSNTEIRFCYTICNLFGKTTTEIVEEGRKVDPNVEKDIMTAFNNLLPDCHTLILTGSKAPGFSDLLYPQMVNKAKTLHKKVILDIRGKDLVESLIYKPDYVKINQNEFAATFFPHIKINENENNVKVIDELKKKILELNTKYQTVFILTNGSEDVLYIKNRAVLHQKPPKIRAVNPIGSGDAFLAGFCASIQDSGKMGKAIDTAIDTAVKNALLIRPGRIY